MNTSSSLALSSLVLRDSTSPNKIYQFYFFISSWVFPDSPSQSHVNTLSTKYLDLLSFHLPSLLVLLLTATGFKEIIENLMS